MKERIKRVVTNFFICCGLAASFNSCSLFYSEPEGALTKEEAGNSGFRISDEELPYFGPVTVDNGDSLFYQIPKFYLKAENGDDLGYAFYEGSVMVVDFFFTSCSTICPIMTSELVKTQNKLQNDSLMGPVKFLSVSIDPDTDTPEVLQKYASDKGAEVSNWRFATRNLEYVDELSKYGFFLAVDRNETYQDGIIHSSQVILIDENRHIRGSYDGVDENEMKRLYRDIKTLVK